MTIAIWPSWRQITTFPSMSSSTLYFACGKPSNASTESMVTYSFMPVDICSPLLATGYQRSCWEDVACFDVFENVKLDAVEAADERDIVVCAEVLESFWCAGS